jgi:hypothetical protein
VDDKKIREPGAGQIAVPQTDDGRNVSANIRSMPTDSERVNAREFKLRVTANQIPSGTTTNSKIDNTVQITYVRPYRHYIYVGI